MRIYLDLLNKEKRSLLLRYASFKMLIMIFLAVYYMYVNSIINSSAWTMGLATFSFIKLLFVVAVFSIVYSFMLISAFVANVYDYEVIYSASLMLINSIFGTNVSRLNDILVGNITLSISDLLLMILGFLLWISVFYNISFVAKGKVSHFMWSLAIILLTLVGLEAMGQANIVVSEWPPASISDLITNSVVILAMLTFFIIEICGNLAYAATIIDEYYKKIDRLSKSFREILMGQIQSEVVASERESESVSKLRLSPLALLMLRGYSGMYALEETGEELSSKVAGLIRSEGKNDREFVTSILGLKSVPRFTTTILSIITGLLVKLPLAILLTLLAFILASSFGSLYPELVEVRTPAFSLIIFTLIVVLFYLFGDSIARRKFG